MPDENGADKLLSEKIMGKFPKVKCNKENLDFDEDDIDGISILSFTTFEQLKEYYPLDKITPHGQKEEVKKTNPKRRRTNKNNSEKAPRKVKLGKTKNGAAKIQVANFGLSQFDKSDSEGENNLMVKTEESPPPSPLPDIPMSVEESANSSEIKVEARPGSSTSEQSTAFKRRSPSHFSLTNTGTVVSSCTSGSPVYQPTADVRIRTQSTASSSSRPPSLPLSARLPTPPTMPASTPPYGHFPGFNPLQRHPVAGMPHVQLDKHGMHFPGNPEHQARLRAELNNHFLSTMNMGNLPRRPFFAGHAALGAHPRPGPPEGALIKKKMEKKWNTCHVRIAHLIYKIQQQQAVELKAKQVHEAQAAQMNGAQAAHNGRSFSSIPSTTRDPLRDFPNFAGAHSLPPTPNTTPFSHPSSPFQSTAGINSHPGHHSIGGLRMPGMHHGPRLSAPQQLPPQFHPAFGPQFWLPPDLSKEHAGHRPPFPHIAGHHPTNEKEMAEAHAAATFKHPELAYGSAASMNELRERFAMDALRHREQQHRESLLQHAAQAHLGQPELHPQLQMEELHKRFQNHSEAHKMNPAMALYMQQQQQQQQHLNNIHAAAVLKYPHITPHQLFNFTRFDSGPSRYSSMLASQPKGPE